MENTLLKYNHEAGIIKMPTVYHPETRVTYPKKRKTNRDTIMECLYNDDEIIAVCNVFKKHLAEAKTFAQERAARRNLTMYVCAIEIGLRGGDFCSLKWGDIFNSDWTFNQSAKFVPQKTRKFGKKVELIWGTNFEQAMGDWLNWKKTYVGEQNLEDYIFTAQKSHRDRTTGERKIHIDLKAWYKIMEKTRKEAGIEQKIGTHGLRKTMVHQYVMLSEDKSLAIEEMSTYLGHSATRTTRIYGCFEKSHVKETKQKMVRLTD